ncbi:DUF3995 domain-containing protein [Oleomonas cavernae]|uniref:DUF3995 domain-containing protein n=1 Tax=Oleomonas cavernae TaxID=2320859 RepID=A0A418WCD6_9PROT|nr:DUF3995 domain-containing protein [Oleomonas cavernae]RJF87660.1 DUF3995 domain-containing protein [Oleomonas cavernae]
MPITLLALAVSVIFAVLGLIHAYWAIRGDIGSLSAGVPYVDGKPAFNPGRGLTLLVAAALLGCALLVAAVGGLVDLPLAHWLLVWAAFALALVLFARSIGDFRLVGFFKKIRNSRFARLDTRYYSPLCLGLAAGVFAVACAAA